MLDQDVVRGQVGFGQWAFAIFLLLGGPSCHYPGSSLMMAAASFAASTATWSSFSMGHYLLERGLTP